MKKEERKQQIIKNENLNLCNMKKNLTNIWK